LIAEALPLNETGEYWQRLVDKQPEIMTRLSQRNQQKAFLSANRVSSKPQTDLQHRWSPSDTDKNEGPRIA
jgi:hypothetical protein